MIDIVHLVYPEPAISFVIPTYNGRAFVFDAINSAFWQTFRNLEIIIESVYLHAINYSFIGESGRKTNFYSVTGYDDDKLSQKAVLEKPLNLQIQYKIARITCCEILKSAKEVVRN